MLRVKQDVVKDPRLGLSKEQLLTRLITMEQEYKNLKSTFEFRRNQQYLSCKQIKDYKDLIDMSCKQMNEYVERARDSNMAIQQLWRMMYSSVDFYKEILDVAKQQTDVVPSTGSQRIVYSIVERIEGFLSNSEFNISKFESIMHQNSQFVEECSRNINNLKKLKEDLSSIDPNYDEKYFWSSSDFSIFHSKSHSKIPNQPIDQDFIESKESLLKKNPSFSSHSPMNYPKSRNAPQNTLSSKTLISASPFPSSRDPRDACPLYPFEKRVFLTAENPSKLHYHPSQEAQLLEEAPSVSERVGKLCEEDGLQKVEKLVEDLAVMVLNNQKGRDIDPDSWNLLQKMFGDRMLVKILKHFEGIKQPKKSNKGASKRQIHNFKNSLMELRKCMMQIEMNVNARDQFLVDEAEQEATQNLFVKSLSIVDKLLMSIKTTTYSKSTWKSKMNDASTNKSNSEWDTKSVSWDKMMSDFDSKSAIQQNYTSTKWNNVIKVYDTNRIRSFSNKRSISVDERAQNKSPDFVIKWDKSIGKEVIKCTPLKFDSAEKEEPWPNNNLTEEDFFNIMQLQASHIENLALYIEDINAEFDQRKSK
jgi:hypothetical protein